MPAAALDELWAFEPIGLEQMQADAALGRRIDRKYVIGWDTFTALAAELRGSHRALEIDGARAFRYQTVYFDSPSLETFRAHMQRRRRRYKVRSRRYVDSGLHVFEVKLKSARGETVKHQLGYDEEHHGLITEGALRFVSERLAEAYPDMRVPELGPTLRTDYSRMTLTAGRERVTIDFDLRFEDGSVSVEGLDRRHVIVESKCERGLGAADRVLRGLGVAPLTCSKYCVGVGLLRDDVKANDLRWLLKRYFNAAGDDASIRPVHA